MYVCVWSCSLTVSVMIKSLSRITCTVHVLVKYRYVMMYLIDMFNLEFFPSDQMIDFPPILAYMYKCTCKLVH